MKSEQQQSTPYLLFLLEYNKFGQIIKAMISQPIANKLLSECGYTHEEISGVENFKINSSSSRFTIREIFQLIYIKGSSYQRAKELYNRPLMEIIRKKFSSEALDADTRKLFWPQFTQIYSKPHFYSKIGEFELPTQFRTAIEKDIKRTYKSPETKQKTQQILSTFAIFNPYIGYCQGMNSIMAFLVDESFTPEECFFMFRYITECLIPTDYYVSMDCIMAYMRIFYELLAITHPRCYTKMKDLSKEMEGSYMAMVSFVLQWFVCLFCNDNVNKQITRVVWDLFMIEGVVALFKAALAMFDFLQPHILECKNYEEYNEMQKKYLILITDHAKIRKRMLSIYISSTLLFLLKQKLTSESEEQKKNNKTTINNNTKNNNNKQSNQDARTYSKSANGQDKSKLKKQKKAKKCNRKWNACFQVIENNFENHYSYQCFVFKPKGEVNIIENYLGKMDKMYFHSLRDKQPQNDLKIGRIEHICVQEEQSVTQDNISDKSTEPNIQTRKKYVQSLSDPTSPIRINESTIRKKALVKVEEVMSKKPGMERSQSMIFMQKMVQNVSFSNLLELYEIDEMFDHQHH